MAKKNSNMITYLSEGTKNAALPPKINLVTSKFLMVNVYIELFINLKCELNWSKIKNGKLGSHTNVITLNKSDNC